MAVDKVIRLEIPATFSAVRTVDDAIVTLLAEMGGVDAATSYNVQLAVHEVCTNVVEHACQCQADALIAVTVRIDTQPQRAIAIELCDRGRPFDPAAIPQPNLDEPQEGGYGLFLARTLLDEVHYRCFGAENVWQLKKWL